MALLPNSHLLRNKAQEISDYKEQMYATFINGQFHSANPFAAIIAMLDHSFKQDEYSEKPK